MNKKKSIQPAEIQDIRHRLGLTQVEMAERMHVTRDAVANWEGGRCSPSGPAEVLLRQQGALADTQARRRIS